MINIALLKREIKGSSILWLIFAGILLMYISIIVTMFDPALGEVLKQFSVAMPQMMAMFGMSVVGATLIEFMANYLYGFLMLIFPMVFVVILANKLVAKHVDSGSMAYLLASPNSRKKVIRTQITVLIGELVLLILFCTIVGIVASNSFFPGKLDVSAFIRLNIGVLGLHLAIAGFCFFASCISNDTKLSLGLGAGVPTFFYLILMLGNMGGKLEPLKNATIFSLFDSYQLMDNVAAGWWKVGVAAAIGILFFVIGSRIFQKRDLPL